MAIQAINGKRGTRYKVVLSVEGKSIHVGTYSTQGEAADAETEAKYLRKQVKSGAMEASALQVGRTFGELVDDYLKSLERNRKKGAHRSRVTYARRLVVWRKELGSKRLGDIRPANIERVLERLLGRLQSSTVDGYLITVSATFSYAVKKGWLARNPCKGLDYEKTDPKDADWLRTQAEIDGFLAGFDDDEWRDVAAFALGTGMRVGECQGLRWSDVSFRDRLITVQRSINMANTEGPTKSGRTRHIPILDSVLPLLRRRKLASGGQVLVFPNPTGRGGYFSRSTFKNHKNAALKAAGIDRNITTHQLKHSFASHWAQAGGNIWTLSKILDHHSVTITEKTYAHLCPDAFKPDYGRVGFTLPSDDLAEVIPLPSRTK